MRKRLLFALGGLVVGVAVSAPLQDALQLGAMVSLVLCGVGGVLIATIISIATDVFSDRVDEAPES